MPKHSGSEDRVRIVSGIASRMRRSSGTESLLRLGKSDMSARIIDERRLRRGCAPPLAEEAAKLKRP